MAKESTPASEVCGGAVFLRIGLDLGESGAESAQFVLKSANFVPFLRHRLLYL